MNAPTKISDRRKRALSRDGFIDRRDDFRYTADFPVSVTVGNGETRQEISCRASDISDGGLHLSSIELPEGTQHLRLKFRVPTDTMPEEFEEHSYIIEGTVTSVNTHQHEVGVSFKTPLHHRLAYRAWAGFRALATVMTILSLTLILLIKYGNFYYFWFDAPVFLYSILVGGYLISRFVFAGFYRPPNATDDQPSITVVIPAHNEEDHIQQTVKEIMESAYPASKLEVIVVNDGSTDHTQDALRDCQSEYPELTVIQFPESKGKRQALAAGATLSRSELVVFVDSDSFLETDALDRIVDGFADSSVAAVTGHCDVENKSVNMLTKMQTVRYFTGFRIMKAAESVFDSVTCLSGPFAAYRRSVLMPLIEEWLDQTFLGQSATFGDDRSLTNSLLRDGHRVLYDSRARCTTLVPERLGSFLRQQIRWKRSWFRESIRACGFIWRRQPFMWLSFYMGFILPLLGPAVVFRALIYIPLFHSGSPLMYMGGILLMSMLMSGCYLFIRRSHYWVYGIHFCYFYLLVLIWQLPWAVLTFWKPDWGTRKGRI